MNFIKRAFWSIKARLGRSILLFIIFTIVSVLVLSGFTIQSAANKASELARKELGGTVTLSYDREKQMQAAQQENSNSSSESSSSTEKTRPSFRTTPVKLSAAESLAKLDHVDSYNFYSSTQALAKNFEPVKSSGDTSQSDESSNTSTSDSSSSANEAMPGGGSVDDGNRPQMVQADLSVSGVLNSATSTDFTGDSAAKITSGRAITASDVGKKVVIVEETLAEQNEWKVGDTIEIQSSDEATTVALKIVGIYKARDTGTSNDMANNFSFLNPYNKIYVPYTAANTLKGSDYTDTVDSAVYTMDDAANISSFEAVAKKVKTVDWDEFKLDANDTLYKQMVGPIENVASFSKNVVYIVSIAGILILALLVMMQIRERKYEMGVLLSIGEKKTKLLGQFFVEIFIVALISFVVAGLASPFVAQVAGNQLLEQQNASAETATSNSSSSQGRQSGGPGGNGGGGPFGNASQTLQNLTQNQEEIKELNIQVTPKELAKMAGIGFVIAFISVVLPGITILRMNPKTILTKQE
ncbi:ABC transporter permease [Listeria floridensis FSL S10-1187]|uniref:ABC transporter permease n=1 Tax=Listeria floridensis FSL S10-1187 TaxID=1265817 RepID=A0ABN0RG71_9LIST|nr:ABC transporter permease [Listeria floridensis]EUJ32794.1 ABC transporter permease [Listeria floridensis FSL S10-1187]